METIVTCPVPFHCDSTIHSLSVMALHELASQSKLFDPLRPIDVDRVIERHRPMLERIVRETMWRQDIAVVNIINGDIPQLAEGE